MVRVSVMMVILMTEMDVRPFALSKSGCQTPQCLRTIVVVAAAVVRVLFYSIVPTAATAAGVAAAVGVLAAL